MLAVAGAAAAVVLLRRRNDGTCGAPEEAVESGTGLPSAQEVSCGLAPTTVARKKTSAVIPRRPNQEQRALVAPRPASGVEWRTDP